MASCISVAAMASLALLALSAPGAAQNHYLPAGARVALLTRTELNTKDNRAGERFYLEVAEPVRAGGQVLIPAGAIAVGEIVRSERNGHFGKSGKIDTRILYIDTNERRYALTGRADDRGKSGTVGTVAGIIVFGALGGLVHGTSGYVKAGTPVTAYTNEDIVFAPRRPDAVQAARADAIRVDADVEIASASPTAR